MRPPSRSTASPNEIEVHHRVVLVPCAVDVETPDTHRAAVELLQLLGGDLPGAGHREGERRTAAPRTRRRCPCPQSRARRAALRSPRRPADRRDRRAPRRRRRRRRCGRGSSSPLRATTTATSTASTTTIATAPQIRRRRSPRWERSARVGRSSSLTDRAPCPRCSPRRRRAPGSGSDVLRWTRRRMSVELIASAGICITETPGRSRRSCDRRSRGGSRR